MDSEFRRIQFFVSNFEFVTNLLKPYNTITDFVKIMFLPK